MVVLSHMSLRIASAYNVVDIRKSQNRSLQMLTPSRFSLQIFLEAVEHGACKRIVGLSIRWGCCVIIRRNRGWGWLPSQWPLGKARHHRQIVVRARAWSDCPHISKPTLLCPELSSSGQSPRTSRVSQQGT